MPRKPVTALSTEQSRGSGRGIPARAHLVGGDVCPKRIDHYIDYFGDGEVRRPKVAPDPCGESLLDANDAR